MKREKQNKRIGIVLDEKNYERSQYIWFPFAKSLLKEGAEIWILPDLNHKFLNKNVFDCFITFSPASQEDDFNGVPFLTVENKIKGHPNIVYNSPDKRNEGDVLKVDVEQFINISSGIVAKLLNGAENILNRSCTAFYEPAASSQEKKSMEKEKALNTLFFEMIGINDGEKFYSVMKENLQKIGVKNFSIVLNENIYPDLKNKVRLFSGEKKSEKTFKEIELLPDEELEKFEESFFDLRPLYNFDEDNELYGTIGYFVTEVSDKIYDFDGPRTLKKIMEFFGKSIKAISDYEKIKTEKNEVEKNSYEKTEFFANMGSDLCEPLENIGAKINQMSENIEKDLSNKEIILEQLLFLKSQIDTQVEKTRTLVELSATQLDDFELEKVLFNPREALPKNTEFETDEKYPLFFGDLEKIHDAILVIANEGETKISAALRKDGLVIEIKNLEEKNFDFRKPKLALAEKILLLHYAEVTKTQHKCQITIPFPNLACQNLGRAEVPFEIYNLVAERKDAPSLQEKVFDLPMKILFDKAFDKNEISKKSNRKIGFLYWDADNATADEWVKIYSLRKNEKLFKLPLVCYSEYFKGKDFISGLEEKFHATKTQTVLFIDTRKTHYGSWATEKNSVMISSASEFESILKDVTPSLIVFEKVDEVALKKIRKHPKTVTIPILVIPEDSLSENDVETLCKFPKILFCNHGACESKEFNQRILDVMDGAEILPPNTGALVKKAILYLNENSSQQIVRWKLADSVHVSEDYLTRVFHQEIGLSLWEYLSRYRIFLATRMLLETNSTIYEIAEKTGFQDQAYFCRVFKKIYGIPPGKVRQR